MEVTLKDILDAREARVRLQQELLNKYRCPLICFTMNIAGPIKTNPMIQRGFQVGLAALEKKLPPEQIHEKIVENKNTGDTGFIAVSMDAKELKDLCTEIEEATLLGRLFDMDVLDISGNKLERSYQRGCIVCGAPGRLCAASRKHSVPELQAVTNQIFLDHFRKADREYIAVTAVKSLIDEVETTPKPGLVDRRNNGSHRDMTLQHFYDSANALRSYFEKCVEIGQETAALETAETFPLLRKAGIEAEKTMYHVTGGINTHKGAIYTLGILCGALGRLWSAECPIANEDSLLAECTKMVRISAEADLSADAASTAGLQCYQKYGIRGIRGEVASGLPSVKEIGLPAYRNALADGRSANDAGVYTLLKFLSQVEDTNLYHRGGSEGAAWAATAAANLLRNNTIPPLSAIEELDDAFIERNLSPGGCADLLAVTYFLHKLL